MLVGTPPGYALRLPDDAVDAWRFEHLLAAARAAARTRPREAQLRTAQALDFPDGQLYVNHQLVRKGR